MKTRYLALCLWLACFGRPAHSAEAPPADRLLPADTLGVWVVPDWDKARAAYGTSMMGQLWQDQALRPFKEKLVKKLKEDLLTPVERDLGLKLADYLDFFHGQMVVAVTQNGWDRKSPQSPALLVLLETRDKKAAVGKAITDLRQKWVDSGKKLKMEKIRDTEFAGFLIEPDQLKQTMEKALPKKAKEPGAAEEEEEDNKAQPKQPTTLFVGQSEGLLIVGNSSKEIEKLLIRKGGGLAQPLSEQGAFQANRNLFKDALAYLWVNSSLITEVLSRPPPEAEKDPAQALGISTEKVISAIGLKGLKSVAASYQESKDGPFATFYVGVPEATRRGLFKMLIPEPKDAAPPAFIPADAVKFARWRLDGKKFWAGLEAMLTEISPQMGGVLQMGLSLAGKEKDPNFDLKKTLIGNLGDDFITYGKAPRGSKLADLQSPPTLYLIGASSPEQLTRGIRVATSLLPEPLNAVKEREFLGRKIYSLALPTPPGQRPAAGSERSFSFAASAGYVALSTDPALLEEFLRSTDKQGKTLRDTPGLNEAAQKVGGMNSGLFVYENQAETVRASLEALKQDPDGLSKALSLPNLGNKPAAGEKEKGFWEWFDYKTLPPFEKIARYFYFSVYGSTTTADGFAVKMFFPTPPALKK